MSMPKRSETGALGRIKRRRPKTHNSYRDDLQNRRPKKYIRQKFSPHIEADDDFYIPR